MTHEKTGDATVPSYRLTCRRCGKQYLEMKDLLFHPCPGDGGTRATPPRTRRPAKRPATRATRARRGTV